ncbi:MAG TPA: STAS domain-containing protein [Solirubrobacteraceae bacterium]|nr:STAS domain-containing protein [Solirubrobacteraceae bacterium]HXB14118.1 STAS domain-containing protein [Solirubrobacteraceae bacterium]
MAIARPLQIETQIADACATLTLAGELDIATVPRLQEAVEAALASDPTRLIIDLRPLGFLDSSGLRQMLMLADRAGEEGWELLLVRPAEQVLAIFQVTRAEENLPFVDEPPLR